MQRKLSLFLILFTIMSSVMFYSCVDLPKDVIAPKWDATFSFPLTDSTITLEEMLDDSTLVPSDDPASLGLLYYRSEDSMDPFYVDTNLTIDGFSFYASQAIGSISINDITPIKQKILVSQWAPSVTPGDTMIFSESESELEIPFPKIDSFSELTLDDGKLIIVVTNNLPVEIQLRGLKIKNAISGTTVINYTETLTLPANGMDSLALNLAGKTVEDSLIYVGTVYSPGSNGTVIIPEQAGTEITGKFKNIIISSVTAVLPKQAPISIDDIIVIDDSTKIERAVFNSGSFDITLNNTLDIAVKVDFTIDNLRKADGSIFTESIHLDRKETGKVISYHSLTDWELVSLTGAPSNEIKYHAEVNSVVSNSPSSVSKTDSVSVDINFSKTELKYFKGLIPPTNVEIAETSFNFDIGDNSDQFSYDKIIWENPGIILTLNSSADLDMNLNAKISAETDAIAGEMIFDIDLTGGIDETIDLRDFGFVDFINEFSEEIPDTFKFSGTATINPNYVVVTISSTDSITGKVNVEIPLDVGISGGLVKDTVTVDSLDMSEEDIEAVNSITMIVEFRNSIPIELKMSGVVVDNAGNTLFPFPPSYNSISEITVPAPIVDENGIVTTPGILTQEIELRNEEAQEFLNNPNLQMEITINTSKTSANKEIPVKFHSTDELYYKIYGKINYRVNN